MLRLTGALLLTAAGAGAGCCAAARQSAARKSMYGFCSLLQWLHTEIQYGAVPADHLLKLAAQNALFAGVAAGARRLGELPVPPAFPPALRQELRDILCGLCSVPRAVGCAALRRAAQLCRTEEARQREREQAAWRLYPRIGGCLGLLAALLLL